MTIYIVLLLDLLRGFGNWHLLVRLKIKLEISGERMKKLLLSLLIVTGSCFAEGSREEDSLALVALQKANPESKMNWDYLQPLDNWSGVILRADRVDSLDLPFCSISILPEEIGNLTNLISLSITSSFLTELPREIGNLTKLTRLSLASNSITTIPIEIGDLKELTWLSLFNNSLTTIPMNLWNLTNLEYLNFSMNSLTTLSAEIDNLTNLQTFYCFWNSLTLLPIEIGNLTNLTGLDISSNSLTELPAEIGNLLNLNTLGISDNHITSIPIEIVNLINLDVFYLEENTLSFSDIELCKTVFLEIETFSYTPQDSLSTFISNDSSFIFVSIGGADNYYQWYKNEEILVDEINDTLTVDPSLLSDHTYHCKATNSVITDLVLWSETSLISKDDQSVYVSPKSVLNSNVNSISIHNNRVTFGQTAPYLLEIFAINGRLIQKLSGFNNMISLNSFKLASGIYQLRVVQGADVFTGKFILK
jgi:Leucine-rich repeat (LRR) protein